MLLVIQMVISKTQETNMHSKLKKQTKKPVFSAALLTPPFPEASETKKITTSIPNATSELNLNLDLE